MMTRTATALALLIVGGCQSSAPDSSMRQAMELPGPQLVADPAPAPQVRVMAGKAGREASPAALVANARRQAIVKPKAGDFVDAVQRADFHAGRVYQLVTTPTAVSVVRLGAGEQIRSIATGDTEAWTIATAEQEGRPLVMVKPVYDDAVGGFVIVTDQRLYLLDVTVDPRAFTSILEWRYPEDRAAMMVGASSVLDTMPSGPRTLYRVNALGDTPPAWKPTEAWTDGDRTVIKIPRQGQVQPALFAGHGDDIGIVQFRRQGEYLVTTRRVERAELRAGQDVVRLTLDGADAAR